MDNNCSYNVLSLINLWRQSGSTTHNVNAAIQCSGILVVDTIHHATELKKKYPGLMAVALTEYPRCIHGVGKRPIFFDTTAVHRIATEGRPKTATMGCVELENQKSKDTFSFDSGRGAMLTVENDKVFIQAREIVFNGKVTFDNGEKK